MKRIKPSANAHQWPRHAVPSVECRPRDLVIRITDWSDDKDEPAYDVEVYIGGVYDWGESESFTLRKYKDVASAKLAASAFAQNQMAKLL